MAMHKRDLRLAGEIIPRMQPRIVDQRSENRLDDLVERAIIRFRNQEYLVPVVNVSARGTMIESDITPRIGETITIQFDNCTRIQGFVRWIKGGRIGLGFGHEIILG